MMTFLRNKFENEFRKGTGWEKAFQEDKKEMMEIPDDVFYVTGRLDKEAENTAVSINWEKNIGKLIKQLKDATITTKQPWEYELL